MVNPEQSLIHQAIDPQTNKKCPQNMQEPIELLIFQLVEFKNPSLGKQLYGYGGLELPPIYEDNSLVGLKGKQ